MRRRYSLWRWWQCVLNGHEWGVVNKAENNDGRYCAHCGADWWQENGR